MRERLRYAARDKRCPVFIQTLQPSDPTCARSVDPGGRRSQECAVNCSSSSAKSPFSPRISMPPCVSEYDFCIRCPAFQSYLFARVSEQRHDLHSRPILCRQKRHLGSVELDTRAVVGGKLPQLDEDDATHVGSGDVPRRWRVADIRTDRVVAVLVLEDSLDHEELFSAFVRMCREMAARRVSDDRGRSCHLVADTIEHAAFDSRHGRGDPGQTGSMNDSALGKICIQVHSGQLHLPTFCHRLEPGSRARAQIRRDEYCT